MILHGRDPRGPDRGKSDEALRLDLLKFLQAIAQIPLVGHAAVRGHALRGHGGLPTGMSGLPSTITVGSPPAARTAAKGVDQSYVHCPPARVMFERAAR